ncbi:MAG: hypothetical protein R3358_12015 [Woeseiaceae bacterium]|nr:hypothetical protein [Woeseiaceae bacterium]
MDEQQAVVDKRPDRWTLIRDAAVLQVKLIVDGLRDFLLVPASLVAAIVSLVNSSGGKPGPQFYELLDLGKRSERWINLFGARAHSPELAAEESLNDMDIDQIVGKVESFVVEEYRRGGITAQAKDGIDKALNAIAERRRASRRT